VALSAFDDEGSPPDSRTLATMLGRSSAAWLSLQQGLHSRCGPLAEEWGFSGKAYGWSLRLKRAKRTIVYLTPCRGHFLASFALGEKACRAARQAALLPSVLALIEEAPKYAEGRGVRIPVRGRREVASILELAAIKLAT
jgi:hypothetical protein